MTCEHFRVTGPWHSEGRTIWYVTDADGDPVESSPVQRVAERTRDELRSRCQLTGRCRAELNRADAESEPSVPVAVNRSAPCTGTYARTDTGRGSIVPVCDVCGDIGTGAEPGQVCGRVDDDEPSAVSVERLQSDLRAKLDAYGLTADDYAVDMSDADAIPSEVVAANDGGAWVRCWIRVEENESAQRGTTPDAAIRELRENVERMLSERSALVEESAELRRKVAALREMLSKVVSAANASVGPMPIPRKLVADADALLSRLEGAS